MIGPGYAQEVGRIAVRRLAIVLLIAAVIGFCAGVLA
jgi:hypothetical protein